MDAVRILLAADYAPTRVGLRVLLEQHGYAVCTETGDAAGAVDAVLCERPDVCVAEFDAFAEGLPSPRASGRASSTSPS